MLCRYADDLQVKLAISSALAQSTKLSVFEERMRDTGKQLAYLPAMMAGALSALCTLCMLRMLCPCWKRRGRGYAQGVGVCACDRLFGARHAGLEARGVLQADRRAPLSLGKSAPCESTPC